MKQIIIEVDDGTPQKQTLRVTRCDGSEDQWYAYIGLRGIWHNDNDRFHPIPILWMGTAASIRQRAHKFVLEQMAAQKIKNPKLTTSTTEDI